jgi:hypothetical protein
MKKWHFPLINPKKKYSLKHYLDHIVEEIKEFEEETDKEKKRKECVDILHAAETFVRKYFERTEGSSFEEVHRSTVSKNKKRGYYR